jgi:cytochrome P450
VVASGGKPIEPSISYTVKNQATQPGEKFDAGKIPLTLLNTGGRMSLIVSDPAIIQDMLVTKNHLLDKTGAFCGVFKNLYGASFVFSKSDATWKQKRKATAHAFYKDRLVHMLDVLKEIIFKT